MSSSPHSLHFSHATKNQLSQLFNRHFYAIGSETSIKLIIDSCSHCNSLKSLPKEIMEQSSGPTPTNPVRSRCHQEITSKDSLRMRSLLFLHVRFVYPRRNWRDSSYPSTNPYCTPPFQLMHRQSGQRSRFPETTPGRPFEESRYHSRLRTCKEPQQKCCC